MCKKGFCILTIEAPKSIFILLRKIVKLKLFFLVCLGFTTRFTKRRLGDFKALFCLDLRPVDFIRRRDHLPLSLASSGWDVDRLSYPASSLLQ